CMSFFFFFFTRPATPEIYTLSLHDALPILKLHPGEVCAEAVVHARAKRQRPRTPAVGADIEAVGVLARGVTVEIAVAGERAHHHHRPFGEGDVSECHLLGGYPRSEGRDRLIAKPLLDRRLRERRVRR